MFDILLSSVLPAKTKKTNQVFVATDHFRTFGSSKLEERVFSHFPPFLPEETWKKVEETPKWQLGTLTKVAVKSFPCILIQYYRFGGIFTLNCNKILHFPLKISNCTSDFS